MTKTLLLELSPLDTTTGLNTTIRLTDRNAPASVTLMDAGWLPAIVDDIEFTYSIWADGSPAPMSTSFGTATISLEHVLRTHDLTRLNFDGAVATVWIGEGNDFSAYKKAFTGAMGPLVRDDDRTAKITLLGPESALVRDLLTSFAGTGNVEGTAEMVGRLKPWAIGAVTNVEPILIDPVSLIYWVDGGSTVTAVYENALTNDAPAATLDSFSALKAASIAPGKWMRAPGLFRLGSQPSGKITADAGTASTVNATIVALMRAAGIADAKIGPSIRAASWPYNLYVTDQITILEAIRTAAYAAGQYLIADASGVWHLAPFTSTKAPGRLAADQSSDPIVLPDSIRALPAAAPAWRVKVGHTRVWSTHSSSEISPAIREQAEKNAANEKAAQDAADAANLALADAIFARKRVENQALDSVLDRTEKLQLVRDFEGYTAERGALIATGQGLEVTTEVTAYVNAYAALKSYLEGLSPAYNDTSADTLIDGSVYGATILNYLAARSNLENANANHAAERAKWTSVENRPTTLTALDLTAGTKLDGIADGADVTGQNTAKDTANVGGRPSNQIVTGIDNLRTDVDRALDAAQAQADKEIAAATPPGSVTGLDWFNILTDAGADVTLTWSIATGATSYEVEISENGGGGIVFAAPGNSYRFSGKRGTAYTARVRALKINVAGAWSALLSFTSGVDTVAPAAIPAATLLGASYNTVTIQYSTPADTDVAVARINVLKNGVQVQRVNVPALPNRTSTAVITNLDKGTAYVFNIFAIDTSNNISATPFVLNATTAAGVAVGDFTPDVSAIKTVTSLPATATDTQIVYYNKDLYRWTGSGWTKSVNGGDITGGTITGAAIAPATLSEEKLVPNSITSASIAAGGITGDKIATKTIAGDKIVDAAIGATQIMTGGVGTQQLAPNSVVRDKIAEAAIDASRLQDRAVTTNKMDSGAVTTDKVADAAIVSDKILNGAITSDKIVANAITGDKIAANQIAANKLQVQSRPVSTTGINIRIDTDGALRWSAGSISYVADNGVFTTYNVSSGGTFWYGPWGSATLQIYYNTSNNSGSIDYAIGNGPFEDPKCIVLASWSNGMNLVIYSGTGTIINGGQIITGSINADRIQAGTVLASSVIIGGVSGANTVADAFKRADYNSVTGAGKPETYTVMARGNQVTTLPANYQHGMRDANGNVFQDTYGAALNSGNYARSYTLMWRVSPTYWAIRIYDVFADEIVYPDDAIGNRAAAMAARINNLTDGTPVVIFSSDEPNTNRMTGGLPEAMYNCGASRTIFGASNWTGWDSYILIGTKGIGEGNGIERYKPGGTESFVSASFSIVNGVVQGGGKTLTSAKQLRFGDGRVVDELYTVQAGATVGAPAGTNVGNTEAQQVTNWAYTGQRDPADRINKGETTTINGGRITTGTVTANEIAAGSISADKIQTGAITIGSDGRLGGAGSGQVTIGGLGYSGDLNATRGAPAGTNVGNTEAQTVANNAYTGARDPAQRINNGETTTINGGRITTGTISANEIAANTITGANIAANTISTKNLLIGDTTNFAENPIFAAGLAGWNDNSGFGISTNPAQAYKGSNCAYLGGNSGVLRNNALMKVAKGDQLLAFAYINQTASSGPNGMSYVRMSGVDVNGSEIWTTVGQRVTGNTGTYQGYQRVIDIQTIPDNVVGVRVEVVAHKDNGDVYVGMVGLMRRMTGELIVDGAITASKIAANTITANQLTVASRPFSIFGTRFRVDNDGWLRWTSGVVQYVNSNGSYWTENIVAGEIAPGNPTAYLFFYPGQNSIGWTTSEQIQSDQTCFFVGKWHGDKNGAILASGVGTLINGDQVVTGSINADRITARTITADRIATGAITANEIAANTISTNKLTVATRPVSVSGINIRYEGGGIVWDAGYISFVDDNGNAITKPISAGSVVGSASPAAPMFIQYNMNGQSTYLDYNSDKSYFASSYWKQIATWNGGTDLAIHAGVSTVINGDRIVTGSIDANRIRANTVLADSVVVGGQTLASVQASANNGGNNRWFAYADDYVVEANKVTKRNNGGWSSNLYTREIMPDACKISARLASYDTFFGLSDGQENSNFTVIDYAWHRSSNGNTYIYENGYQILSIGDTITNGVQDNILQVVYDGRTIRYIRNEYVHREITVGANRKFSGAVAIAGIGQYVDNLSLTPYTDNSLNRSDPADRINNNSTTISGGKITTGSITANQIAANTITGDKLVVGTISAAQIASGAITATKLAIGNPDNIIPDGNMLDVAFWNGTAGSVENGNPQSFVVVEDQNGLWKFNRRMKISAGNAIWYTPFFPVEIGASYKISYSYYTSPDFAGYINIALHLPGIAWWCPKIQTGIDPTQEGSWSFHNGEGTGGAVIDVGLTIPNEVNNSTRRSQFRFDGHISAGYLEYMVKIVRISDTTLIQDGAITTNKITVNSLNGDRISVGTLDANRIVANSVLSGNVYVSSSVGTQALDTVATRAANPAQRVNESSTQIDPGRILISGGTSLASWRNGGDNTKIEGGSIAANTISANKLTIGNRNISVIGCDFEYNPGNGQLTWRDGHILYTDDNGNPTSPYIPAGSVAWNGGSYNYIVWDKGAGNFRQTSPDDWAQAQNNNANCIIMATWRGGSNFVANYGGTIINGDHITTGTVNADRIQAGTVLASSVIIGGVSGSNTVADAFKRADYSTVTGAGKPETYTVMARGNQVSTLPANYQHGMRSASGGVFTDTLGSDLRSDNYGRSYTLMWRIFADYWAIRLYDVYGDSHPYTDDDGASGAQAMANRIAGLPNGTPVVIFTSDEPNGNRMTAGLPEQMYSCGASRTIFGASNWTGWDSYILIGTKGIGEGNGIERYKAGGSESFVSASFSIVNGVVQGSGKTLTSAKQLRFDDGRVVDELHTVQAGATVGAPAGTMIGNTEAQTVTNWAYTGQQDPAARINSGGSSLNADRLTGGSALPNNLYVSGTSTTLGTINAVVQDPAYYVNINSTTINGGKITTGSITAQQIAANSIKVNNLVVGARAISSIGLVFEWNPANNWVSWSDGYLYYQNDDGSVRAQYVNSGNTGGANPHRFFYWIKDGGTIYHTQSEYEAFGTSDRVMLGSWWGGSNLNMTYGGTNLNGNRITTGSITADRLNVGSLSAISANIGSLVSYNGQGGRVERDGNGTRVYGNNGVLRVKIGF